VNVSLRSVDSAKLLKEIEKVPIDISGCLLGEKVRYAENHKFKAYINESLSRYFEFKSLYPEPNTVKFI
jgi:uncharacterized protein YbbK (DUF523 family)